MNQTVRINFTKTNGSGADNGYRQQLKDLSRSMESVFPLPSWNGNRTMMYADRQTLSRMLYLNNLYQKILGKTGIICEFGVQFGATMSLLTNLRGIYEPYNYLRRIVGFDTFSGFASGLTELEKDLGWEEGDYGVPAHYQDYLSELLRIHETNAPISHRQKFELVSGDIQETWDRWLHENPSSVIALAIFDMDVYAPTRFILEKVMERMPKGAVLAFDELNYPSFPGETIAVNEVLGIRNLRLETDPNNPAQAWHIID